MTSTSSHQLCLGIVHSLSLSYSSGANPGIKGLVNDVRLAKNSKYTATRIIGIKLNKTSFPLELILAAGPAHSALIMAPALTITTNMNSRPPSPVPPPMSPITPPLPSAQLSVDANRNTVVSSEALPPLATATAQQQSARPTFTHSQSSQVGVPPPAPAPIEFETNPDVIALRSAITVLQMQRSRATADIQTLSQIKNEAIDNPDEFIRDLAQGRIGQGARLDAGDDEAGRAWAAQPIPKAQDVVRCPPINWSQYAVVGESLDKLHAEQVAKPTQGTPATVGAGGVYQFKGGDGKQEEYPGVAAPYAPLKDKIEKKTKTKK